MLGIKPGRVKLSWTQISFWQGRRAAPTGRRGAASLPGNYSKSDLRPTIMLALTFAQQPPRPPLSKALETSPKSIEDEANNL